MPTCNSPVGRCISFSAPEAKTAQLPALIAFHLNLMVCPFERRLRLPRMFSAGDCSAFLAVFARYNSG